MSGNNNMRLDRKFIESVISDVQIQGAETIFEGDWISDSRLVTPRSIFVALSGARVDGHSFVGDAFEKGAAAVMIAQDQKDTVMARIPGAVTVIIVKSTREALIQLATAWRAQFNIPIVGVTGSVGKTTTKELIASILRLHGMSCLASVGNFNTEIGLAMTLLRLRSEHQIAVVEMGISRRGEMARLAHMVRPTTAVITALGHSHMEGLGSIADIAAEKRAIFSFLQSDGIGIINGDQPLLGGVAYAGGVAYTHPVIKFGCKMINHVQARQIQVQSKGLTFVLKLYNDRRRVHLNTENEARVYNVLAAAAVAHFFGVPFDTIVQGIEQGVEVPGRFEKRMINTSGSWVIDDSYNANPESMKDALKAFEQIEGNGRKIAVLGDMLELGVDSPFWHRQLGRFLRKAPSLSHVILVGEQMKWAEKTIPYGLSCEWHANWQAASDALKQRIKMSDSGACILVKASRGMALNNLVSDLMLPQ